MSIRYKLMLMLLLAVLLPMLLSISVSKYFSTQTRELAAKETIALAKADVEHIIDGSRNLIATNKSAMDQGRINTIKTFLRSAADLLYDQVSRIYYTVPEEERLEAARKLILAGKFGSSGYAFAMDGKGTLVIHPTDEGTNLAGKKHIDEMIAKRDGFIRYTSATTGREKFVHYRYFAPLDLIIAPGAFVDELTYIVDLGAELDALEQLQSKLRQIKVGQKGFFWVMEAFADGGGDYLVTPFDKDFDTLNLLQKDGEGNAYIPQLIEQALQAGDGVLASKSLRLLNPQADNTPQQLVMTFSYFQPLNWVIGTALPEQELYATSQLIDGAFGKMNLAVMIATLALLALALLAALLAANTAIRPIRSVQRMAAEMALGHLDHRLNLRRKDELGEMAKAMDSFAEDLQTQVVASLRKLANGDLTFSITPRDEQDQLRGAIKKLEEDLNDIMQQILSAGDQIASGSIQVSDSAQSLSQGATESAASIEQISASMTQMAGQTRHSAENASQANQLSANAMQLAQHGNQQMDAMVQAMSEIRASGENISKIIKVIDEIAFQTNLLALNAAVEAARAGQHGKGFAVVAEEVRNLAARSAKAAEETTILIENSVEKTQNGSQIASQTAAALGEIVQGITKVSDLVHEIAAASTEQAEGIGQVNQGLGQIDQVIQQNTAAAEESAATSEELSGQAGYLKDMLSRFKLKNAARGFVPTPQPPTPALPRSAPPQAASRGQLPPPTAHPGNGLIIEWNDSLNTGIQLIDRQHRRLVDLINKLFQCMKAGGDRQSLDSVVDELIDYTVTHFRTEEDLMKKHHYPDFEAHKRIHDQFVAKVADFANKLKSGARLAPADIYKFLKDWLLNHIKDQDRDGYAPHVKKRL
jgi:methyl-accepting chemotaxis protein